MTYVRQSGRSAAQRRARRRAAITLSVLCVALIVAFVIALGYNQGWIGARSTAAPTNAAQTCSPVQPAPPRDVIVNVYNATDRNGLARAAAKALTEQGFRIASVTNDPLQKSIPGIGEVRWGSAGTEEARAVLLRVPGARSMQDTRADASVDLVLGESFTAISVVGQAPPPC